MKEETKNTLPNVFFLENYILKSENEFYKCYQKQPNYLVITNSVLEYYTLTFL